MVPSSIASMIEKAPPTSAARPPGLTVYSDVPYSSTPAAEHDLRKLGASDAFLALGSSPGLLANLAHAAASIPLLSKLTR
jgi:hypothetical protein